MRVIPRVVVASTRIIGLIVPAFAAEMTGAEITGITVLAKPPI